VIQSRAALDGDALPATSRTRMDPGRPSPEAGIPAGGKTGGLTETRHCGRIRNQEASQGLVGRYPVKLAHSPVRSPAQLTIEWASSWASARRHSGEHLETRKKCGDFPPASATPAGTLPFESGRGRLEEPKPTLTVEQTAKLLGISRGLAFQAVARGDPSIRIGRRILIPATRLLALLERTTAGSGQHPTTVPPAPQRATAAHPPQEQDEHAGAPLRNSLGGRDAPRDDPAARQKCAKRKPLPRGQLATVIDWRKAVIAGARPEVPEASGGARRAVGTGGGGALDALRSGA
jgi:excisionase family DNA binding protein